MPSPGSPHLHWPQKGPPSWGASIQVEPLLWPTKGTWGWVSLQDILGRKAPWQGTKWASQRGSSKEELPPPYQLQPPGPKPYGFQSVP